VAATETGAAELVARKKGECDREGGRRRTHASALWAMVASFSERSGRMRRDRRIHRLRSAVLSDATAESIVVVGSEGSD
jgi:hypothetical protein